MEKYPDPYAPQDIPPYPPQSAYPQMPPPPPQAYPPPNYPPQIAPPYGAPQAYPPMYQSPNTAPLHPLQAAPAPATIIVAGVAPIQAIFGPMPVIAYCKHCNLNVTTRTEAYVGCMVWLMFLVFYLLLPCVSCIPFCITTWYDVAHYCPKCSRRLGTFVLI